MDEPIEQQNETSLTEIKKNMIGKSFFSKNNIFTAIIILIIALLPIFLDNSSDEKESSAPQNKEISPAPTTDFSAKISFTDGDVEIWSGKVNAWLDIIPGKIIGGDSQIRTGKQSRAIIEFTDKNIIRLDENSHIILKKLSDKKIESIQIIGRAYYKTDGNFFEIISGETKIVADNSIFFFANQKLENKQRKVMVEVIKNLALVRLQKGNESIEKEVRAEEKLIINLNEPVERALFKTPLLRDILKKDNFYLWNKLEDGEDKSSPSNPPEIKIIELPDSIEKNASEVTEPKEKITLHSSYQPGSGVTLYWALQGKAPYGFRILRSAIPNPTYPGSEFVYLPSPSIRSYIWPANGDIEKYYFKICLSGKNNDCPVYSNEKEEKIIL